MNSGELLSPALRCAATYKIKLLLRQAALVLALSQGLILPVPAAPMESSWAFRPAERPDIPAVKHSSWAKNPIDYFILQKLESNHLQPSPQADRRTLIRRLSFDLTGIPPAPEQVEVFVQDSDPAAYEKLVDHLLASPHYGERWARHWLDAVHYGETHGYDKDKPRPNAWPYRDYVIRSFNSDKPYSRFVQEQIAGDVLFPAIPDAVIATGFIAAGPWDFVGHVELPETKTDGLIARYNDRDDMVMTVMSTFQSLTVHCARCHDHKFDPISQKDYYRLQAVFAGVDRADRWYDSDPDIFQKRKELLGQQKNLTAETQSLNAEIARLTSPEIEALDAQRKDLELQLKRLEQTDSPSNGYHSAIETNPDQTKWVQLDFGHPLIIDFVRLVPARPTDFPDTPGFGFPVRFTIETSNAPDFSQSLVVAGHAQPEFPNPGDAPIEIPLHSQPAQFLRITAHQLWERTKDYVFALGELEVIASKTNIAPKAVVTAQDSIESGRWAKKFLTDGFNSRHPLGPSADPQARKQQQEQARAQLDQLSRQRTLSLHQLADDETLQALTRAEQRLSRITKELAALPPSNLVYAATANFPATGSFRPPNGPRPVHLLRRGDVKTPGALVEPGTLDCLPGLSSDFELSNPEDEGGRRAALAQWITDHRNVLTRRSIVNRIWQQHFGRAIVDTPNDFGKMGSTPSHPELLDWLAFWFVDQGESLKALHRMILTSATYQQASADNDQYAKIDGENRYLWRMNRTRLDAESIRDATLYVSGSLDLKMGGPSAQHFLFKDDHSPVYDYAQFDFDTPGAQRRSIYRFIVRSVPDPFMETLDCPDPSLLAPKRNTTITALQALTLLNNPFMIRQSEQFAHRLAAEEETLSGQIELAYQLALNRRPSSDELSRFTEYAHKHGLANACRILLNSNEFIFID